MRQLILFLSALSAALLNGCDTAGSPVRRAKQEVQQQPSPTPSVSAPNASSSPQVSPQASPQSSLVQQKIQQPSFHNQSSFISQDSNRPMPNWSSPSPHPRPLNLPSGKAATCMQFCETVSTCMTNKAQSFCKWDKKEPNCYGLHWSGQGKGACYFHGTGSSCNEEAPIKCGILRPLKAGAMVESVDFLPQGNSCEGLCQVTKGCLNSRCNEGFCEGLHWTTFNGHKLEHVIHASMAPGIPEHQRVPCGVYGFVN